MQFPHVRFAVSRPNEGTAHRKFGVKREAMKIKMEMIGNSPKFMKMEDNATATDDEQIYNIQINHKRPGNSNETRKMIAPVKSEEEEEEEEEDDVMTDEDEEIEFIEYVSPGDDAEDYDEVDFLEGEWISIAIEIW